MIESFLTAFVIYFVVIDPVGSAPVFLSVTSHLTKAERYKVALETKQKMLRVCKIDFIMFSAESLHLLLS